jgi:hypothetical protein
LTPDPLVANPWNSQALHRYSYARNNPLRYVDPSGFQETPGMDPITKHVLVPLLTALVDGARAIGAALSGPPRTAPPPPAQPPVGLRPGGTPPP